MTCCHYYAISEGHESAFSVDLSSIVFGPGVLKEAGEHARALGVEFNPNMVELAKRNAAAAGVADLDGDGDVDLATTSGPTEEIFVLRNDGSGRFFDIESFPVGPYAHELLAVDVDVDGDLDLITENHLDDSP